MMKSKLLLILMFALSSPALANNDLVGSTFVCDDTVMTYTTTFFTQKRMHRTMQSNVINSRFDWDGTYEYDGKSLVIRYVGGNGKEAIYNYSATYLPNKRKMILVDERDNVEMICTEH